MIISDLAKAYDRLVQDPDSEINQDGFCFGKIDNLAVIDNEGNLIEIVTIDKPQRTKLPENLCPGGVKKNILYDSFEYFFGLKAEGDTFVLTIDGKSKEKQNKFECFKKSNLDLLEGIDSEMANAMTNFLSKWDPSANTENGLFYTLKEDLSRKARSFKGNFTFCLNSINNVCYHDAEILSRIKSNMQNKNMSTIADGVCCITGEFAKIAQKHKSFSGSQNFLISVDNDTKSFHSFGKTWCYDSPVSEEVMNKYTAALNYFYRSGSKNKTFFGEDLLIFWADGGFENSEEELLLMLGHTASQSEESNVVKSVRSTLSQLKQGMSPSDFETPDDTKFYLLLLSKNAARFSVKKYIVTTFGTLKDNVFQHHCDMRLSGINRMSSISQLMEATMPSMSTGKVNSFFAGALADAIFYKSNYPSGMLSEMIARFKTDNPNTDDNLKLSKHRNLTNTRVAFIKAYLTRKSRLENKKEEIDMSLNLDNKEEAYLLGRLFAVMEKAQQDAIVGVKSTIKDRFFASACSTPATVFPSLIMGYQNHIAKLERGSVRYEKLFSEIIDKFQGDFSNQFDLINQGRFIVGYYQQRTALWSRQTMESEVVAEEA